MNIKTVSCACVLAAAAAGAAHAQTAGGGEPLAFLNLDANARAVGLGGAYTALAADSNALLYNPAGLGRLKSHEITFMQNRHLEGVSQQSIGYAAKPGLGLNLNYLSASGITRTRVDAKDGSLGTLGSSDLALGGGYGKSFMDDALSLGFGLKYLRETIDSLSANGYAADLGALGRVSELPGLAWGASLLNVGPPIRFLRDKENLPLTLRGGVAYAFTASGTQNTLAFDLSKQRSDKVRAGLGAETLLGRVMALRFGFTTRHDAGIGITGGVGWLWQTLGIDYAFVPFGDLGITHRLSLTFRWGSAAETNPAP